MLSQPRRNSGGSGIAPAPLTRPPPIRPLDSMTKTSTLTPSLTPTSTSSSSKTTAMAPPKAPTTTTSTNKSLPTTTTTTATTSNQPSAQPPAPPKPKTKTKHSADPPMTFEQQAVLLAQTNWIDRTLWVSRQLFGGQALNGFLRATATAQRVKKQRAHQTASARAKTTITPPNDDQQQAEEQLKLAVMNARMAKKIKTEFKSGLQFCEFLHGTIRQLLQDMDPVAFVPPPPLGRELPSAATRLSPLRALPTVMTAAPKATTSSKGKAPATKKPPPALSKQAPTTASLGNPTGSTLRRH